MKNSWTSIERYIEMISSPDILVSAKRNNFAKCSCQSELRERSFDQSATNPTRYFSRAFLALFSDYSERLFLALSLE